MGRRIQQTLFHLGLHEPYETALIGLGVSLEEILNVEADEVYSEIGLQAASWLEALATYDYPSWGYTL
jgi:glucan phosphorylase